MAGHRWSGWPGAWCLDCGVEDKSEVCISDHDIALEFIHGHYMCDAHEPKVCEEHSTGECPEPGSMRYDPHAKK